MTLDSFEEIDADKQLVAIGERLEETSINELSSYSLDPSMLIPKFESCSDLKKASSDDDGLYTLWSDDQQKFIPTLCMFDSTGSYAVMQSRVKGKEDLNFLAMMKDGYEDGFGNSKNEFWLGLDRLSEITKTKTVMKVVLAKNEFSKTYIYKGFQITSKSDEYRLLYDSFENKNEIDYLSMSKGAPFHDYRIRYSQQDPYRCMLSGAWWFYCTTSRMSDGFMNSHVQSNLNGVFTEKTNLDYILANRWDSWPYENGEFTETRILLLN